MKSIVQRSKQLMTTVLCRAHRTRRASPTRDFESSLNHLELSQPLVTTIRHGWPRPSWTPDSDRPHHFQSSSTTTNYHYELTIVDRHWPLIIIVIYYNSYVFLSGTSSSVILCTKSCNFYSSINVSTRRRIMGQLLPFHMECPGPELQGVACHSSVGTL